MMKKNLFIFSFILFILFPSFVLAGKSVNFKDLDIGTQVELKGVVIVEPGILGQQNFYLNGLQIYSYYKDFPKLRVGDEILVKGIISQSRGEKRLKIKSHEDIKILNQKGFVEPLALPINKIDQNLVGFLVKIKGTVIEKTGQEIFIDDGTGEITVYLKPTVIFDRKTIKEGDKMEIIGVLSQSNDKIRLLPRNSSDIFIQKQATKKDAETIKYEKLTASGAKVLNFNKVEPYFIVSSVILGLTLIFLIWKQNRKR